ncbi:MAG: tetratricopeptide repeat protein, partial [Actinomycetia bacterium]|nr:tetratricopeptide repeat protein [Actinomycetes bacterium]
LPAFLFFAADTDWRSIISLRNITRIVVYFLLGLLPFLYEPIAALQKPEYNYGDPSTLTRWFHHMTLYYQQGGLFSYPLSLFPNRLWRYFGTLNTEFPYFAWLGGLGFLSSFRKRSKKYPLFLILLFLLALFPAMTYNQNEPVLRAHFYYPSYLIFSLWIGIGAAYLIRLASQWSANRDYLVEVVALSLIVILLFMFPALSATIHYKKVDKSNYYYAYDMAQNILDTAEPGSIVLFDSDNTYFPCRYLQVVENVHVDVRVVHPHSAGVPGFGNEDLWVHIPSNCRPMPGDKDYIKLVESLFHTVPVYHTTPFVIIPNWKQVWYGYLIRVYPGDVEPEPAYDFSIDIRGEDQPLADLDSDAREALLLPAALAANQEVWQTNYRKASGIYREITDLFIDDLYVPTLFSCETYSFLFDVWGQVLNLIGEFQQTVRVLPRAKNINPDFISLALAKALSQTGNQVLALTELDNYLAFYPENATARMEKGIVLLTIGNYENAIGEFREAVRIDSANPNSQYFLGLAFLGIGNVEDAIEQFNTTIELDPAHKV